MSSPSFLPMSTHNLCLEIKQNNKSHTPVKSILKNINITLKDKGITAIIGANGAGKTALLKCCVNLTPPSSGTIEWHTKPSSPAISFVPQQPVLLDRSVYNNILMPLQHNAKKAASQSPEERSKAALNWANIDHLSQQPALTLSSGEQQLLALARAWALQPAILFLDEPCANLDPQRFNDINELILQLSQSCKIVFTSHSLEQVQELAKEVILLDNGSLITQQDSETFFSSSSYQKFISPSSLTSSTS